MYICVHDALGLLGLDRNGFSDPYCVIYCNGKKVFELSVFSLSLITIYHYCAMFIIYANSS